MNNKETSLPFIIGLLIFVVVVSAFSILSYREYQGKNFGMVEQQYETTKYSSATSTTLGLATSTDETKWIIPISLGVDQLNLDLRVTASSTSGRLDWSYEWSEDRIDWYAEDIASTTPDGQYTEHSATTTVKHRWLPGVATEVAKSVVIPDVNANFLRINFERGVQYENFILWAEVRSHTN